MNGSEYRVLLANIYETHRGQLQHEDNLVNHRVSWLVGSQSFLLGTYVFLINSPLLHMTDKAVPLKFSGVEFDGIRLAESVELLRRCFSLAGMIGSLAVGLSVWAALFALRDLVLSHEAAVEHLDGLAGTVPDVEKHLAQFPYPKIISKTAKRVFGCMACALMPALFASVWLAVFLGIGKNDMALGAGIALFVILAFVEVLAFSRVLTRKSRTAWRGGIVENMLTMDASDESS